MAEKPHADLIRASVIASRFGGSTTGGGREPVLKLRAHFSANAALRNDAFWVELVFVDEVSPSDNDFRRLRHAESKATGVNYLVI